MFVVVVGVWQVEEGGGETDGRMGDAAAMCENVIEKRTIQEEGARGMKSKGVSSVEVGRV